jgi:hypothetical protein
LFGLVASDAAAWRVLDDIDDTILARIRTARAQAREVAWGAAAETGRLTSSTVGGFTIPGFVLDIDAMIVVCPSEKEGEQDRADACWVMHPCPQSADRSCVVVRGVPLRPVPAGSSHGVRAPVEHHTCPM